MKAALLLLALDLSAVDTSPPVAISEQRRLWVNSDTFKIIRGKGGRQQAEARGHVEALHGPYRLTCEVLVMQEESREGTATGDVVLDKKEEGMSLRGGRLVYHENLKQVEVTENPSLVKVDPQGRTTTARGQMMSFDEDSHRGEIRGGVTIVQGGMTATCGKAIYEAGEDVLLLSEEPVLRQGRSELRGQAMTLTLSADKLRVEGSVSGKVYGDAGGVEGETAP